MSRRNLPRILMLALLLCLAAAAAYFIFFTAPGTLLRHHPHQFHQDVALWADRHSLLAPVVLITVFTVMTLAAMPVWWLQVLAGAAWGLWWGIFWCDIAATIAATVTFVLSRWLTGEWMHGKIEQRMARLRHIDEKLSHNGFSVVMAARLVHVLPFGLSYYMFGLTTMTALDVAVGTLLGYLPSTMLVVHWGVGWRHMHSGRFVVLLVTVQGVLMIPIVLRYIWPEWFRKMGLE